MQALTEGIFSQLAEPNSCQFCQFFPQLSVLHACKKGGAGTADVGASYFFDRLLVVHHWL